MDSPKASGRISRARRTFACIRCTERKVRCDKQNPCNACIRHKVECIPSAPKPARRKRALTRDDQITETSEPELETTWKLPPQAAILKPQLLRGQRGTELVDNILWSRVAEEEIHDDERAPEEDSRIDASDDEESNRNFAYVLDTNISRTSSTHPSPEAIRLLWQTFMENVNPLTKLVHVPSLQLALEKAINNIKHIPKGFEALMFSIYSMSVLSLTNDECENKLGETREVLLGCYVAATKAALSRANFMSSTSIVVLQALVLHIFSIRDDYEPRAVWSLTGVAIRVAEAMGVGIDGTLLGLSPFKSEIRRRIWWQLKLHDFRTAELSGQAKFGIFKFDENTPRIPANVNDIDLNPTMVQSAPDSDRPTEMLWCMFRFELANFAATQMARLSKDQSVSNEYAAMDDLRRKNVFIKELEEIIESKHLRFCDPSQPLQLMALLGARCTINVVRFMAHHPRRWKKLNEVPVSEQQLVLGIAIQLLEQYNMMQSSPQLGPFAWSVPYFIQWHAIIHILDTLREDPVHQDAGKSWRLIETFYNNNTDMLLNTKRPILRAIGSLCLKAFDARQNATAKDRGWTSGPPPPEYIIKLRQEREQARSKCEVFNNDDKEKSIQEIGTETGSAALDTDITWPAEHLNPGEAQIYAHPRQSEPKASVYPAQDGAQTDDDEFWLTDALSGHSHDRAGVSNMDAGGVLSETLWLDTPHGEIIDWDRWDGWFGNVNIFHPNMETGTG